MIVNLFSKQNMQIIRAIFLFLFIGMGKAETIDVASVQDSLISRFNRIDDYSVKIKISVQMTGLRMPRKKIKLYYKAPDQIKVESRGFAIVPKTGLGGSPDQFLKMLESIHVVENLILDGKKHWLLNGTVIPDSMDFPISESEVPQIKMNLWVDAQSWVITQAETLIDSQKVFHVMSEYKEIDEIHLPIKTTLSIGVKGLGDWSMKDPFGGPDSDRKKMKTVMDEVRDNREEKEFAGTITMEFSKYKVNQGIDDALFMEEK